ncbi:hypothetical protein ACFYV5_33185 [Streptomyces sp. NPDC003035]|uniref:hypothetical protein n=1 Tax=Streptomyces sp. NPDC003035 TaxID=3364676 RepID=UPI003685A65C
MVAHYSSALEGVADNPALPAPLLLRLLAQDEDPVVDQCLAVHHPDTPEEVLMRVYVRLGGTRRDATGDPRLPLRRLREALGQEDLAYAAGGNPALPEGDMAAVMDRARVPA